jgi:hypothetical protein
MELLQNAHDALADGRLRGTVEFVVTEDALLVANEGVPFDEERIGALMRLGASDKTVEGGKRHTIGYKGVGFTSVFEISETPQCVSRDVAFAFDQARARDLVHEALELEPAAVPTRGFPFAMEIDELEADEAAVRDLLKGGAVTVIRLPFRDGLSAEDVSAEIESALTPEVLLFMPSVQRLRITSDSGRVEWARRLGRKIGAGRLIRIESADGQDVEWLALERSFPVPEELVTALDDPLWTGITSLNVAAALPWRRGNPRADAEASPVHVYYPTNDMLGRAVLIHGDFYVKSDRRRIETEKAGGEISALVGRHAALAVADLAESVADRGNALLHVLAPSAQPDGFGKTLADLMDGVLRERRIIRTSTGGRRPPTDVKFLALDGDVSEPDRRAIGRMIGRKPDVMKPGDEQGVEAFLEKLWSEALEARELAGLLTPSRRAEHESDLSVLARWVERLYGHERTSVVDALRAKPMLRDTAGVWRRPDQIALRVGDLPRLPRCIAKTEIRPLKKRGARELVRLLRVDELDAARALELVISATATRLDDTDSKEIHDFVLALWGRHKKIVADSAGRLGAVRVPAGGPRAETRWVPAKKTYFSAAWLGADDLERLYGQFRKPEFLAIPPPIRGREQRERFYALLGVTVAARPHQYEGEWDYGRAYVQGLRSDSEHWWSREIGTRNGVACHDHPSSQRLHVTTIDRLDDLLRVGLTRRAATALANVLARQEEPFGGDDESFCQAQSHRGRVPRKRLPGYQAWLLTKTAWVPVRGFDGSGSLARPAGAWLVEGREEHHRLLPRAQVRPDVARALRLPTPTHPTIDALEELMRTLESAFPILAEGPESARQTALWAQGSLNRLLRLSSSRQKSFAFAVDADGVLSWERAPLANDLPGRLSIPGIAVLPGPNEALTRVYELDKASEAVSLRVIAGTARRLPPLLSAAVKAMVVALILARNLDAHRAAVRLEVLAQRAVDELSLEVSFRGTKTIVARALHLEIRRSKKGAVVDGVLYRDHRQQPNLLSLAEQLGAYLDVMELSDRIALLLASPDDVLNSEGIGEIELSDASQMLRGVRRHAREDDEPDQAPELEPIGEEPAGDGGGVTTRTGGTNGRPPAPQPPVEEGTRADPPDLIGEEVTFGTPRPGVRRPPRGVEDDLPKGPPPVDGDLPRRRRGAALDEVEARAISIAKRYGTGAGVDVKDVQRENLGWDLEFFFPDGAWRPVEVKGTSGDGPLILTRGERIAALENADYELIWVTNLANPAKASLRIFEQLGSHLEDGGLETMSWEVADWSAMPHEETAVREIPVGHPDNSES